MRGKTTFIGTAQEDPRTSPCLLLDFEGNVSVLRGLDIDIWPVRSHEDFGEAYAFLKKGDHHYKTVALDSLTETSMYFLLAEMARRERLATGASTPADVSRQKLPDQAQQQDYGAILVQQRRLLRRLRDLPMHVIYTALEYVDVEPGEGLVKMPSMQGSMRREAGGMMTVVGYLDLDREKKDEHGRPLRKLLIKDQPGMRVNVRTEWQKERHIPNEIEKPTVTKLLNVLFPTLQVVRKVS